MGRIINFEGIPGVGKTTIVRGVCELLRTKGYKVAILNEINLIDDSKSKIMNMVLKIFTHTDKNYCRQFDPYMDTFFSQAVRYLICKDVLSKNMEYYDFILEDRGRDSYYSFALGGFKMMYGISFEESLDYVSIMNSPINDVAEHTFLLYDDVNNCLDRCKKRGDGYIDDEDVRYLENVSEAYSFLAQKYNDRITILNVDGRNEKEMLDLAIEKIKGVYKLKL